MCNMQGDAQGKIVHAIPFNRAQAMHAGSTTFIRLSSQNETLNKQKRLPDGEASLEENNEKLLNQILQEKEKKKKAQFKKKCNWSEPN